MCGVSSGGVKGLKFFLLEGSSLIRVTQYIRRGEPLISTPFYFLHYCLWKLIYTCIINFYTTEAPEGLPNKEDTVDIILLCNLLYLAFTKYMYQSIGFQHVQIGNLVWGIFEWFCHFKYYCTMVMPSGIQICDLVYQHIFKFHLLWYTTMYSR